MYRQKLNISTFAMAKSILNILSTPIFTIRFNFRLYNLFRGTFCCIPECVQLQRTARRGRQAKIVCLSSLKHNTFGNKLTKVYNLKNKLA